MIDARQSRALSLEILTGLIESESGVDAEALTFIEEATKRKYDWTRGLKPQEVKDHEDWQEGAPLPVRDGLGRRLTWMQWPVYQGKGRDAALQEVWVRVRPGLTTDADGEPIHVPDFHPTRLRVMVADLAGQVEALLDD